MNQHPWWSGGLLYQIYLRSFGDSDGDGVGDINGVTEHLEYLAWLGVDGIWLTPVNPSPNVDWGYDVTDYFSIDPAYGSLDDFDALIAQADRRGIHVLVDLVPNHTSAEHPWFRDAISSRHSHHRDWYVWADPSPAGGPPNNWLSSFGGPAWTFDRGSGQYYLHNFLPEQPDLNWWNPKVRDAFDQVMRFWLDRGVAGYRIDVCHGIVKDALLRDNPPARDDDPGSPVKMGQRLVYSTNRPEIHDLLKAWRRLVESYDPPRILLGETHVLDVKAMATFYGKGDDELNLAFNFPFLFACFDAQSLRSVVERAEAALPRRAIPVWTGSNHDESRLASRWAQGRADQARLALMMLLGLRGTAVLYQGDEIGLVDTPLTAGDLRDPLGIRGSSVHAGRDPQRSPMPWRNEPGGGFTRPDSAPWLPFGNLAACNVADQRADKDSMLHLVRDLLALRRSSSDLRHGDYVPLDTECPELWAWRRGVSTIVTLNFGPVPASVAVGDGRILVCTNRRRDGEGIRRRLTLGPWEGAVVTS